MPESAPQPSDSGRRFGSAGIVVGCLVAVLLLTSAVGALSAPVEDVMSEGIEVTLGSEDQDGDITAGGGGAASGLLVASNVTHVDEDAFSDPDDDVHFVVEANQPASWRISAYDVYEGDRWRRSGLPRPRETPPGNQTRSVQPATITFQTPARTIPAAWRPIETYDAPAPVTVDGESGYRFAESVPAGESITVTSLRPAADPQSLHDAGADYPSGVQWRYTQLPENVSQEVFDRTDELTAEAESRFETAAALESWFRSSYEFDRNVSLSGEGVVGELLFEREAGYSAPMATAMTVMLRGEDIPSRYVVGYKAGEFNDSSDHYEVRGTDAHAWVEVYFPDHGWVPFDPTPVAERGGGSTNTTDAVQVGERELLPDPIRGGSETNSTSSGGNESDRSPQDGESPQLDEERGNETKEIECEPPTKESVRGQEAHCIELLGDPIPGNNVTVAAFLVNTPATDVPITINGEYVGFTNRRGLLNTTVPFSDSMTVTAYKPFAHIGGLGGTDESVTHRDYSLPTDVNLSIDGPAHPGHDVTLEATIRNESIPAMDVLLDDRLVSRTDVNGTATLNLPDETGTVTARVERGPVTGETVIDLSDVQLSVDAWPAVLPGWEATATVTFDNGDPAPGVAIYRDGEFVATTDADGTATITPGATLEGTVSARGASWRVTTTIQPLVNLSYLLLPLLVLIVVGGLAARRRGVTPFARVSSGTLGVLDAGLTALVVGSSGLDRLYRSLVSEGSGGITSVLRTLLGLPAELVARVLGLPGTLAGLVTADSRDSEARADVSGEDRPAASHAIRRAWDRLIGLLPVSRPERHTPADLADRAIRAGLPRGAVETILDAFRRVEYGGEDPDEVGEEPVRKALGDLDEGD